MDRMRDEKRVVRGSKAQKSIISNDAVSLNFQELI